MFTSNDGRYCISTFTSYAIEKKLFNAEIFNDFTYHIFENHQYKIVSNYDVFLKQIYGDYMKLPPKNKQIAHLPEEIEFIDEI